jgi:hypothetical protein
MQGFALEPPFGWPVCVADRFSQNLAPSADQADAEDRIIRSVDERHSGRPGVPIGIRRVLRAAKRCDSPGLADGSGKVQFLLALAGGALLCDLDRLLVIGFQTTRKLLSAAQLILVCPFADTQPHSDHGQADCANGTDDGG